MFFKAARGPSLVSIRLRSSLRPSAKFIVVDQVARSLVQLTRRIRAAHADAGLLLIIATQRIVARDDSHRSRFLAHDAAVDRATLNLVQLEHGRVLAATVDILSVSFLSAGFRRRAL